MLGFFFNRKSKFITALEIIGIIGFLWLIFSGWFFRQTAITKIFFAVYLLGYILIRFCASFKWYGKSQNREAGIQLHFKKTLVAASYIIFLANLITLFGITNISIYVSVVFFVMILHLNAILLYFHWKDRDETAPNFLTRH